MCQASGSPATRVWCVYMCPGCTFKAQRAAVSCLCGLVHLQLCCRSEDGEQYVMRQWQNGGADTEREVIWKADKFEEKHNAEAVQGSWNTAISWMEKAAFVAGFLFFFSSALVFEGSCACSRLISACSTFRRSCLDCVSTKAQYVHLFSFKM